MDRNDSIQGSRTEALKTRDQWPDRGTGGPGPANLPVIQSAHWDRAAAGKLSLTINGTNFSGEARVDVNGGEPKKKKFKLQVTSGSNVSFGRIVVSGKLSCTSRSLIKVINPGDISSAVFQLDATCP